MANYKVYEYSDFTAGDSPAILDFTADIGAGVKAISILNDGPGSFLIAASEDGGSTYGDDATVDSGEYIISEKTQVDRLRITRNGEDSAYRVVAAKSPTGFDFGRDTRNLFAVDSDTGEREAVTSTDQRLNVNAQMSTIPDGATFVQERQGFSTVRNKINYVVPVGKTFHITGWVLTGFEGKMQLEIQIDGSIVDGAGILEDGTTFAQRSVNADTPIATATAGQTVRARREAGDSGKDWFASIIGFLEDV